MLTNMRHEAFAHAIARGLAVHAAYVEAGYKKNDGNASRLNGNPKVIERVAALRALVANLQERSSHGVVLTREWVIEQLITGALRWRALDDSAGANKALNLLGLELGMFVERKETGKPGEFDGLTIAGKRERAEIIARSLGLIPQSVVEVTPDDAT